MGIGSPPDVASIMGVVDTFVRWQHHQTLGTRKYFKYHPSEWGKCLRTQQYRHYVQLGKISVEEADVGSKMLRLWQKGHNMQSRWEKYFEAMNILRGYWDCANPLCEEKYGRDQVLGSFKPEKCSCGSTKFHYEEVAVIDKELNIYGHADIILDFSRFEPDKLQGVRSSFNIDMLPTKPIVIDMKTIGDWSWKKQLMKQGLHKAYMIQILIYAHILDCEYGLVIYENKNNSETAAYKVPKNDDMFDKVKWQSHQMQQMAIEGYLPPPKPESKAEYECKNCPFSTICHKSAIWEDEDIHDKRLKFYGPLL